MTSTAEASCHRRGHAASEGGTVGGAVHRRACIRGCDTGWSGKRLCGARGVRGGVRPEDRQEGVAGVLGVWVHKRHRLLGAHGACIVAEVLWDTTSSTLLVGVVLAECRPGERTWLSSAGRPVLRLGGQRKGCVGIHCGGQSCCASAGWCRRVVEV